MARMGRPPIYNNCIDLDGAIELYFESRQLPLPESCAKDSDGHIEHPDGSIGGQVKDYNNGDWKIRKDRSDKRCCCGGHNQNNHKKNLNHATKSRLERRRSMRLPLNAADLLWDESIENVD